jgi:Ran GTPase-activating protein (RanGAP) involved in mRNA processing and transport
MKPLDAHKRTSVPLTTGATAAQEEVAPNGPERPWAGELADMVLREIARPDIEKSPEVVRALMLEHVVPRNAAECASVIGWFLRMNLAEALERFLANLPVKLDVLRHRDGVGLEALQVMARALQGGCDVELVELELVNCNLGRGNGGSVLGDVLRASPQLRRLNLTHNEIAASGARQVFDATRQASVLSALSLHYNRIGEGGATGDKIVADGLVANAGLTKLSVADNELVTVDAIAEALKCNTSLIELDLSSNGIGDSGASAMAGVLRNNTTLCRLQLHDNGIGSEGGKALGDALVHNRTLTHLGISGNQLGASGAEHIAQGLRSNTSLKHIDLANNAITLDGAVAVAGVLESGSRLGSLDMSSNPLGSRGVGALVRSLEANDQLSQLSLSDIDPQETPDERDGGNAASDTAFAADGLALALAVNRSLQQLELSGSGIGPDVCVAIAEGLRKNTSLLHLTLDSSRLEDRGLAVIAALSQTSAPLISLSIRDNEIGDDEATALAGALKRMTNLKALNLTDNNIGHGFHQLADALLTNTSLLVVELGGNAPDEAGIDALCKAMQGNLQVLRLTVGDAQARIEPFIDRNRRLQMEGAVKGFTALFTEVHEIGTRILPHLLDEGWKRTALNLAALNQQTRAFVASEIAKARAGQPPQE